MTNRDIRALEKEYDCKISETRVQVWDAQLRLYDRFNEICSKHHLRHFMFWGSLLGAVRHNGFIPWDDDIDVVMPREDYNIFGEIAEAEIQDPYFILTKNTATGDFYYHLKLIDKSTTCIYDRNLDVCSHHQGITLDIVPLDGFPADHIARIIQYAKQMADFLMTDRAFRPYRAIKFKSRIFKLIGQLYFFHTTPKSRIERTERIKSKYSWDYSDYITEGAHYHFFRREDFEDTVYLDFENRKVPAPVGYKRILEELYGDYMKLPDVKSRMLSDHEAMGWIIYPNIPYEDCQRINSSPEGFGKVLKRVFLSR